MVGMAPYGSRFGRNAEAAASRGAYHSVGVAMRIVHLTRTTTPQVLFTLHIEGVCRVHVDRLVQRKPYAVADVTPLEEALSNTDSVRMHYRTVADPDGADTLRAAALELLTVLEAGALPMQPLREFARRSPAGRLADVMASIVYCTFEEKLAILDAVDVAKRVAMVTLVVVRQVQVLRSLSLTMRQSGSRTARSSELRSMPDGAEAERPMPGAADDDEVAEIERRLRAGHLPDEARAVADRELARLKRLAPQQPEYAVCRNYLEWMTDLPWRVSSTDRLDLAAAQAQLDADHYGLEKVRPG